MKHFTIMMSAVLFALTTNAQTAVEDSVELGAGYANSVFYKLADGNKTEVSNSNWNLAFDVTGFGVGVRINGQAGTGLWEYPNGDTAAWSSVDTTGISAWSKSYNSDEDWYAGALNNIAGSDPFDVGWGMYNSQTHHIIGDKLFIIKLSDGSYKRLWIEGLIGGVYTFRYGNLTGELYSSQTVTKSDFADKNFAYFSLQNDTEVDREPNNADWDFVVQKYEGDLGGGTYYGVTGVLTNVGVYATEARGVDVNSASHWDYTSDSLINTIGYDWKEFDMNLFQFVIEDDLSYFVYDVEGNIWQVVFTGFQGSSTGKVWFNKTLVSATGINDVDEEMNVAVYPNPSTDGNVSLVFNLEEDEAVTNVYDMTGKLVGTQVFQGRGFKQRNLQLTDVPPGTYILQLLAGNSLTTKKLIIQ